MRTILFIGTLFLMAFSCEKEVITEKNKNIDSDTIQFINVHTTFQDTIRIYITEDSVRVDSI